jgi:hypothetical protein
LGHLFGTKNSVSQTADTVILIVPSVVESTSAEGRRKIKEAFAAFRSFKGRPRERKQLSQTWSDPAVTDEVAIEPPRLSEHADPENVAVGFPPAERSPERPLGGSEGNAGKSQVSAESGTRQGAVR